MTEKKNTQNTKIAQNTKNGEDTTMKEMKLESVITNWHTACQVEYNGELALIGIYTPSIKEVTMVTYDGENVNVQTVPAETMVKASEKSATNRSVYGFRAVSVVSDYISIPVYDDRQKAPIAFIDITIDESKMKVEFRTNGHIKFDMDRDDFDAIIERYREVYNIAAALKKARKQIVTARCEHQERVEDFYRRAAEEAKQEEARIDNEREIALKNPPEKLPRIWKNRIGMVAWISGHGFAELVEIVPGKGANWKRLVDGNEFFASGKVEVIFTDANAIQGE